MQGGSTLTQQLARTLWERPPGLAGKLAEAWWALRLEARLGKSAVLATYLERTYYGHLAWGADSAARTYFDKPVAAISLSEAALLAALPRAPSALDPWRSPVQARAARDRVLDRLEALGWIDEQAAGDARAASLHLRPTPPWDHAPHLVRRLGPVEGTVSTTVDLSLQRAASALVADTVAGLRDRGVRQAAVLVADVQTAQVLAYVGSAGWGLPDGQVDGVRARRSPGSALKPFVYWLALEPPRSPLTLASVLPDLPATWSTSHGSWSPSNYDDRFHGPLLARDALGRSTNLPAVHALEAVGVDALYGRLRELGLTTLDEPPSHYGLGLALGDAEVRLDELAAAYLALATGHTRPLRFRPGPAEPGRPIGDPAAAWLVLDALDDPVARAPAFGLHSVLEADFPLAAKTGTSVGFRDNWAIGLTPDVVVAAWVGRFDGAPMADVSGVTGAGPLMRRVAELAHRGTAAPPPPAGLVQQEVCPLSGLPPSAACPGARPEWFLAGTAPERPCDWHQHVEVDATGALATGCRDARTLLAVRWPARFADWAAQERRPRWPTPDRSCAASTASVEIGGILSPADGTAWFVEPSMPVGQQRIPLRAAAPAGTRSARWSVDGQLVAEVGPPFLARWAPVPGSHRVELSLDGRPAGAVRIDVGGAP